MQRLVQEVSLKLKLKTAFLEAQLQFLEEEERRLVEKVNDLKNENNNSRLKPIQMAQLQGRCEVATKELEAVQRQRDDLVKEIRASA